MKNKKEEVIEEPIYADDIEFIDECSLENLKMNKSAGLDVLMNVCIEFVDLGGRIYKVEDKGIPCQPEDVETFLKNLKETIVNVNSTYLNRMQRH